MERNYKLGDIVKWPLKPPLRNVFDTMVWIHPSKNYNTINQTTLVTLPLELWNERVVLLCHIVRLILGLRPSNERYRYKVTPSLIGRPQT